MSSGTGQIIVKRCFDNIKEILISDLSSAHFNPVTEIVVPSEYSIRTVILHKYKNGNMKAVFPVSHSLIAAEKNYSQIQKEALVIIFAVKKFHRFVHGRRFWL